MFTRTSGGKGGKNFGRWGSLKDKRVNNHGAQLPAQNCVGTVNQRLSTDSDSVCDNVQTFQRAALYVLGEKAQMKVGTRNWGGEKRGINWIEWCAVINTRIVFM